MRGSHGTDRVPRPATCFALAVLLAAALAMTSWAGVAHAATFAVTNTDDSGPGSLRQAITDANANANPGVRDAITFAIPAGTDPGCVAASGVCTISPQPDLPDITEPVSIDGYTQPGASPNTLATGNDARLKVEISGADAGGGANGLRILASNSVVRGLIINGWSNEGVELNGVTSPGGVSSNRVQGNYIGTDASGEVALANVNGVRIVDQASDNLVGGASAAARNVISGNFRGVLVTISSTGNRIQGNYIGTDASGTQDLGNEENGVEIRDTPDNLVGGASAAARNVISGNDEDGVYISGNSGSGNEIRGNFIGTDASGTQPLGNGDEGVYIDAPIDNVVGGASAATGNTVAYNAGDGVDIDGSEATGNSILRNSIHSNGELGIDLDSDDEDANDVTPNDPQDPDPGPNLLQNFPVITSAQTPDGRSIAVRGNLNSTPTDSFDLQFFASPEADPSGFGEGKRYLGQTNVVTNAGGNAAFSFSSANAVVPAGYVVTATATNNVTGDTSEFSEAFEVEDDTAPRVISTNPPDRATGVLPGTNVSATFSEQMRASTINTNTFRLFRKVGPDLVQVPATVSYSPGTRRGVLNPNANLEPGSQYVARVYLGARDLANNQLAEVRTFTFFVRE